MPASLPRHPDDGTDAALAAVRRPQEPTDNAYPSGWSAACGALLSYAALTGSGRHREAAEAGLAVATAAGGRVPRAFGWALAVAEAFDDGPREVAVVGPDGDPRREALRAVALAGAAPGLMLSVGEPDADGVPLLAGRPLRGRRSRGLRLPGLRVRGAGLHSRGAGGAGRCHEPSPDAQRPPAANSARGGWRWDCKRVIMLA